MPIDVRQARAFLTLAEELHFGNAAERLNIAQPPLSRMIKQLENSVGYTLFNRTTRTVELTIAGEALLDPAHGIVKAADEAERILHSRMRGTSGKVSIGFAGASTVDEVARLALGVKRTQPNIDLEFSSSEFSHRGIIKVLDGQLDIALGRWDFLPPELDSHLIANERIIIALPQSHRLANRNFVDIKELAENAWIMLPEGYGSALNSRIRLLSKAAGFIPRIVQSVPDSWTQMVFVAAEMGCAFTLDSVARNIRPDGVKFIPLKSQKSTLEVRMIWHSDIKTPAIKPVVDVAKNLFDGDSEKNINRS